MLGQTTAPKPPAVTTGKGRTKGGYALHGPSDRTFWKRQNYQDSKNDPWLPGVEGKNEYVEHRGLKAAKTLCTTPW